MGTREIEVWKAEGIREEEEKEGKETGNAGKSLVAVAS